MIAAWKKRMKDKKLNNEGSTIVLVIIALAFVGMLIAMLVYMVYYNYLMKYTDRAAKDNFYTAETALNEIQAGITKDVSVALQTAYSKITANNSADSSTNQQAAFETEYTQDVQDNLDVFTVYHMESGENRYAYNVDRLMSYLSEPYKSSTTLSYVGTTNRGGTNVHYGNAVFSDNVLILQDVCVSYTNSDGYVSIIETDIAIETPEMSFNSIQNVPEIEYYSLVAGEMVNAGVDADGNITANARVDVDGRVYGGDQGINVNGNSYINFVRNANDADTVTYTLAAGSINAVDGYTTSDNPPSTASITISDAYDVYTEDLYVESAFMDLESNCFVRDDLTIDGRNSKVVLAGNRYVGYGYEDATAENSSAILINGVNTVLDFKNLKSLQLSGSAYVGSIHYNANETVNPTDYIDGDVDEYYAQKSEDTTYEETVDRNTSDVLMGQSLAVKSDQLMYMVPVECMGYKGSVQVLGKNPMTIEEYNMLAGTYEPLLDDQGNEKYDSDGNVLYSDTLVYTPVKLDVIMNKVGNSANSYGASAIPVFRRVSGSILVYYYLKFDSADSANKFFRDYYAADSDAFNQYFRTYVKSFSWNSQLGTDDAPLSIAGNMLYMNTGSRVVQLKEDTSDADFLYSEAIAKEAEETLEIYTGLSKYLSKTTSGISSAQLKNNVFDNIVVDDVTFSSIVPAGSSGKVFKNTDDSLEAILVNNDGEGQSPFVITDDIASKCKLVIARGDVVVNAKQFSGLILAGGTIQLGSSCQKISYDAAGVKQALNLKNDDGDYVFEVIVNGVAYIDVINGTDPDLQKAADDALNSSVISASQLVKFQNWSKR
jgi:hypothetical protein